MSGTGPVPQSGGSVRFGGGNPNPQMDINRRVGVMYGNTNTGSIPGMPGSYAGAVNNAMNLGGGVPQQQQQPPRGNLPTTNFPVHSQTVSLQGGHRTGGPIPSTTGVGSLYAGSLGMGHSQSGMDVSGASGSAKAPGPLSNPGVNMSKLSVPNMGNISAPPGLYGPNFSPPFAAHSGHTSHASHGTTGSGRGGPTGGVLNPSIGPLSQPGGSWVQRTMHPDDSRGYRLPSTSATPATSGGTVTSVGAEGSMHRPIPTGHVAPTAGVGHPGTSTHTSNAPQGSSATSAAREAEIVKAFNDPMQYRTGGLRDLVDKDTRLTDGVLLTRGVELSKSKIPLGSSETVCNALGIPWSDSPYTHDPQFSLPVSYRAKQPALKTGHMEKFHYSTLMYMFYGMARDLLQAYAAKELHSRGWNFNTELKLWFTKLPQEPIDTGISSTLSKASSSGNRQTYSPVLITPPPTGYLYFDIQTWSCQPHKNLSKEVIEAKFMKTEEYNVRQNVAPPSQVPPSAGSQPPATAGGRPTTGVGPIGTSLGAQGAPRGNVNVPHLGQQRQGMPYAQVAGGTGPGRHGRGGADKHAPN